MSDHHLRPQGAEGIAWAAGRLQGSLFAALYDLFMAPAEYGPLGRWRRSLVAGARNSVLEIGAGTGLNFRHYAPEAWVIATDPDAGMLRRAVKRASRSVARISLVVADGEALPFRDHVFAEATVGLAMCTIPHPERAIAELHRTLGPGGRLRLLEHVRVSNPVFGALQDWLTPLWSRVAGGCRLNRRTTQMLAQTGLFEIEGVESHLGGYVQHIHATARVTTASIGMAKEKP